MAKKQTIIIDAEVRAALTGMNKVVSDLEEGLKKQTYDLSKNTGLAKYIKQYKEAKDELEQQIDLEPITAENAAKVVKMGNKVTDIYKKINQAKAKLQKEDDSVLRTLFPDKFSAKVDKGIKTINKFFHEIEDKQDKKTRLSNLEGDLNRFQTELARLEKRRTKIDIEADLTKARKDLSDFEQQRRELLNQVQEKLTPSERIGMDGKTAIQRYSDQVQASKDKIARKSQAISDTKKSSERALTQKEQTELEQLKARHEGRTNEYTVERNSTRKIYNKYAEELAIRRTAVEMGVKDTGRPRRKLGGLSGDELQIKMEEARTRLAELEAENTAALKRIEQIKTAPSRDKKNTIQKLERELEAERKALQDAEDNLAKAREARQKEIDFGRQQAQKFESGEVVAGVDQSDLKLLKDYNEELEKTGKRITDLQFEKSASSFNTAEQKEASIGTKKSQIAERTREIQKLKSSIEELENSTTIDELFKKLNELSIPTDNIEKSEEGIKALRDSLKQMDTTTITQVRDALKALGIEGDDTEDVIKRLIKALDNVDDSAKNMNRAAQDMENLKQQVLDFFSITNAVQLFKQTVQSALNTVKELDATMTEAAVVTDFSIGDMWDQLPRYSKEAQKLGVSINGMYQATTLYYQQGLKTNEAMELGVETMKMAKIAAMDSSQATTAMTSALRGFNMELNETSATRVNDVYSQLAAVTAADTNQIATAMEKTASIASSANMEFETTAAFLAQIIETTQEAPETAGTALKTIIARFSEVKSLKEQGLVSGEDSEGEIIDVNKIQTALRSVGISMDEYFAGTEGLDDVLLKLAEKWGTLDFETQRYIATMAAGSRQQSRFIAMMSDYSRTQELVSAANNSAGASQKQFEKTTESLESSLTKLKNAWDQFTMGLANNEILKFGIDLLTGLLETVNKVTDAISGDNGLAKSIVSLFAVIGALKGGKALLGSITTKVGDVFSTNSYKETITEEVSEDGKTTVKRIIKEPYKQGKEVGREAGRGFLAGFQQGAEGFKEGKGVFGKTGGFFSGMFKEKVDVKKPVIEYDKEAFKKQIQKDLSKMDEDRGPSGEKRKWNREERLKLAELKSIRKGLDEESASVEDLTKKYEELGGEVSEANGILVKSEKITTELKTTADSVASGIASIGTVAIAAGTAISALGEHISESNEDLGEFVSGAGQFVAIGGSIATMAPSVVKGVKAFKKLDAAQQATIGKVASWAIVITLVVTAIAAIGNAIKKANEAKSLDKQLEKVNQRIEGLNEILTESSSKLEDLVNSRKELDKMEESFNGLTKGTKEWQKQLFESNSEVLELIDKYPELARYITKGEHGQLQITEEGWAAAEERAYQQQAAAQNAITAAQIDKNELLVKQEFEGQLKESDEKALKGIQNERIQADSDFKKTSVSATAATVGATGAIAGMAIGTKIGGVVGSFIPVPVLGTLIGAALGAGVGALNGWIMAEAADGKDDIEKAEKKATGGLTQEEFSAFAAAAAEQSLSMATAGQDKEGFRQLYESMGYDPEKFQDVWEAMEKMGTGFDELAGQALALKEANNQLIRSSAENAMSQTSVAKNSEMYSAIVERQVDLNQDYDDQVAEKAKEYDISKDKDYDKEESKEVIKKYADLTGQTTDEVRAALKNESLSPETIANALAAADINGEMADSMDNMAKVFEKNTRAMTDLQKRTLSGLIGKDTKTVYLNELGSYTNKNTALATLQAQGVTDADAKVLGYESLADYAQALADEAFRQSRLILDATGKTGMHNELQGIRQQLEGMGIQITSQQALGFNEILNKVNLSGGSAQEFARMIPNLLQGVDQNQIGAALDIISSSSVATTGDIDVMVDSLRLLGANIDDNLIQKLYNVSDALKTVDFSQLENQLQNLGKATDSLSQKMEQNQRTFSTEEKTALVEAGVESDLFVRTGIDEWSALTDINSLLAIIDSKIGEILFEIRGNLEENVQKGQKIASVGNFYEDSDGNDKADKTISGLVLLEEIYSGKRDLYGEGSDLNVSSENLKQLAIQMGLNTLGKTDEQLLEMVKTQYEQYYGIGGAILHDNLKQLYNQGASANQLEASKAAGTENFYRIVDSSQEAQNKEQQVLDENEVRMSFLFNEDEVTEDDKQLYSQIAESEQIHTDGGERYYQYDISPSSVLKNMIQDPDFYSKWNGNEAMLSIMQNVGQILGLSGVEELDFSSLYTAILQVHKSGQLAEETLTALVNSTAGAGSMIDITTQSLKEQGSALAKDEVLIKNLVIATTRQNKKLADFGKTLQSSNEILEEGAWGTERYSAALENIALSLEQVTGIKITDVGFLDKNRKLLLEIQKGGEGAAEAYKQLMWNYLAFSQGVETSELIGSELGQIITQALNEAVANGGTIDLTSYVNQIAALEGQNAESAKNALGIWFSIMSNANDSGFAGTLNDWSSILGTSKSSQQKWENPYDVFYNTSQKINQSLREREKLERQYQRLVDRGEATAEKLLENQKKQVAELQEEAYLQNDIIAGRKSQMNKYVAQKGLKQYAWVDGNGNVQINWKAINAETDQEKGAEIEEYISQLEEWSDSLHEAEDRLEEIEDEVHEINEQGKDEYLDLEQTIADALKESYQSQIDKLSEINESINDTNSKLIESMQAAIDKDRQARENEKAEEDIVDKQQQLAYLQQDTSGANALEILKLQEEIDQAQEDYTDTLIDQKISDLQKQNEKAAEQRERQIQIAQDQLDQWIENGEHWGTVEELIREGTDETRGLIEDSSLDQLLKSAAGFEGMSHVKKMDWLENTNTQVGQALAWLNNNGNHILDLLSGTGNSEVGNYVVPDGNNGGGADQNILALQKYLQEQGFYHGELDGLNGPQTKRAMLDYQKAHGFVNQSTPDAKMIMAHKAQQERVPANPIIGGLYNATTGTKDFIETGAEWLVTQGSYKAITEQMINQQQIDQIEEYFKNNEGIEFSYWGKKYHYALDNNLVRWVKGNPKKGSLGTIFYGNQLLPINKFKTGGLANYTGPAWLDGTKSKPELVLNARDTQNFIQLKDVLSSIMSKPTKSAENSGDINYDIDINVETIQEQADLDMIANYIENKIVTSAGYRNNNLVRTRR